MDLPCSRCASSLRGISHSGQCPGCGLDVSISLSLAVHRFEDREQLERIKLGLDTQAWGTIVALLGAVLGPLVLPELLSCQTFAIVVTGILSTVAAVVLVPANRQNHDAPGQVMHVTAMALGSIALFIPALVLRTVQGQQVHLALVATMLVGGLFWFAGECAKMRLLEACGQFVTGREIVRLARHLRWGTYSVILLMAFALLPAVSGRESLTHHITDRFILMLSVSLLVVTLLGALLYGRMSTLLAQQVSFSSAIRKTLRVDPRFLPDEPDCMVEA